MFDLALEQNRLVPYAPQNEETPFCFLTYKPKTLNSQNSCDGKDSYFTSTIIQLTMF